MRSYEIVMRSGAKTEVMAEILIDEPDVDAKVYFYRDKGLKQLVAYFIRAEIAGIVVGPDNASVTAVPLPRFK
jgi:hypothetical protein